jgi:RNA-directed DNA polymerase
LKCGYVFENKHYPTTEGTPQGGINSPMLCNAVLNGLETKIRSHYPLKDSKGYRAKVYVSRFADDIIVTGENEEILYDVKLIIKEFLEFRDLEMKETKTSIKHISEGFDFLGFNISRKLFNPRLNQNTKQETVLIIKPSKKAIDSDSINLKIKEIIDNNSVMEKLVKELNPIIRG